MTAAIEASYKAREVESWTDLYFYRPIGFQLARGFAALGFTPSMVSMLGAVLGVLAGHLYFYRDLRLNVCGMALHVLTNALDNADGQLARLTNRGSLQGAIVDGCADYIVFGSVYLHLSLRYLAEGGSAAIWLLAVAAGLSHMMQSMMIDYYRNGYLQFALGKRSLDQNSSEHVAMEYARTRWGTFWRKLGLRNYLNYTRQQERLAPSLLRLRQAALELGWSTELASAYRSLCLPLVKWCNGLATNPRMVILFAVLLLGRPIWYFWIEVTLFNLVFFYLRSRQAEAFRTLLAQAERR